jgi:hypothetical protein
MLRHPQKRKLELDAEFQFEFEFVATEEQQLVGDSLLGGLRNLMVAVLFLMVCRETVRICARSRL